MAKKLFNYPKKLFRNDLERSEWLSQLESLLQEGLSLSDALQLMKLYEGNRRKFWVEKIYNALLEGNDFSSQLKEAGYSNDIVSNIVFAEKYGDLQEALKISSDILKKRYELIRKSKRTLYYPAFLIVCLIIMSVIFSEGIYPQFLAFFQSMDQELPMITKIVIQFLSIFQLPFIIAVVLLFTLFLLWFLRKPLQYRLAFLTKIPIIRTFTKMLYTHYFVSQLSPMLKNGFSLQRSLSLLIADSRMKLIQEEAKFITRQMTQGEEFSSIVQSRVHFEPQLSVMITLGEVKGRLGEELENYGKFLFKKQYEKFEKMIAVIQPLLFGSIGIIVIVLFFSIMAPIFNMVKDW